jgi:type IV pilus assembly protein PilA
MFGGLIRLDPLGSSQLPEQARISSTIGVRETTTNPVETMPISWRFMNSDMQMKTNTRSVYGFTLVEIMIVVVIIGLLAAMAIPAFQKVRQTSQDKAVLNNTRQLSAAADQYFLEHGVPTVAYGELVGTDKYIKQINTVAQENYPGTFTHGITITVTNVGSARTVTYSP